MARGLSAAPIFTWPSANKSCSNSGSQFYPVRSSPSCSRSMAPGSSRGVNSQDGGSLEAGHPVRPAPNLPLDQGPMPVCRRPATFARMARNESRVVYIVDDDASLRRSLRNLLSSVGFRVETFESAEAYLDADHRLCAGCLVLDLRMPGMGGLALLGHLEATHSPH